MIIFYTPTRDLLLRVRSPADLKIFMTHYFRILWPTNTIISPRGTITSVVSSPAFPVDHPAPALLSLPRSVAARMLKRLVVEDGVKASMFMSVVSIVHFLPGSSYCVRTIFDASPPAASTSARVHFSSTLASFSGAEPTQPEAGVSPRCTPGGLTGVILRERSEGDMTAESTTPAGNISPNLPLPDARTAENVREHNCPPFRICKGLTLVIMLSRCSCCQR